MAPEISHFDEAMAELHYEEEGECQEGQQRELPSDFSTHPPDQSEVPTVNYPLPFTSVHAFPSGSSSGVSGHGSI